MVLERPDRNHCEDCLPEELRTSAMALRQKLKALRVTGADPAHSETANQRRGDKVSQRQREFRQRDAEHGREVDREVFQRETLPGLQSVSLQAMAKATGLSEGYCSFIRRGSRCPTEGTRSRFGASVSNTRDRGTDRHLAMPLPIGRHGHERLGPSAVETAHVAQIAKRPVP